MLHLCLAVSLKPTEDVFGLRSLRITMAFIYIYLSDIYIYIYVVFGEVVTGASALVNRSVTHVAGFFGEVFSARWFWCVWK